MQFYQDNFTSSFMNRLQERNLFKVKQKTETD